MCGINTSSLTPHHSRIYASLCPSFRRGYTRTHRGRIRLECTDTLVVDRLKTGQLETGESADFRKRVWFVFREAIFAIKSVLVGLDHLYFFIGFFLPRIYPPSAAYKARI